jgi:hypothetical protein
MNKFIQEQNSRQQEDLYDNQTIAMKILMDDIPKDFNTKLQTLTDENDDEDDPISFFFELLINIYLEIIHILIELDTPNMVPKITSEKFDNIIPLLKENMKKISILTNISVYHIGDGVVDDILKGRYCKIILRHNPSDQKAFKLYASNIPSDKNFHFLANPNYQTQTELKKVYGVVVVDSKVYCVSFSQI